MNPLSSHIKQVIRHTILSAKLLLAVSSACLLPFSATAAHPDGLIEIISAPQRLDEGLNDWFLPERLLDGNVDSKYHTWDETHAQFSGEQYLEVTLKTPLNLAADEDIVVYLQRCNDCDNRQPTAFKVTAQEEGRAWEDFCHVYFLYRGRSTKEYSARIHTNKKFKKLRFYVVDNNTRSYDSEGHHSMGLSEFEIYKVKRGANYPGGVLADPFHKVDDYKYDYKDYEFINTMGWLDVRNRSLSNTTANQPAWEDRHDDHNASFNNQAWHKGEKEVQELEITKIINWANWEADWQDGKWIPDTESLSELGIQMPDMSMITDDKDFDSKVKTQCQPTHVTEHILYALPGDPVILTPYPTFAESKHYETYEVNFAHWYDYRTGDKIVYDDKRGNRTNLLDFLADPTAVCVSDHNGFYGAYLLTEKKDKDGQLQLPWLNSQN